MGYRARTRGTCLLGVLIAGVGLGRPLTAADAAVTRIAMLPLAEKTTIVVELSSPVLHVEAVQADSTAVVLEAGPVGADVRARDLTPAVTSPFVTRVTLRGAVRADGATYLRLRIALRAPAVHQRRAVGSRIYVDLAAPGAPVVRAPTEAPATEPAALPGTAANGAGAPPRPQPHVEPGAPPEAKRADAQSPTDAAYQALESSTLRRGRELASRPDVKGLLRLGEEVRQRDKELGNKRTDLVNQLMIEVLKYTDQARALQLEQDRRSFSKQE